MTTTNTKPEVIERLIFLAKKAFDHRKISLQHDEAEKSTIKEFEKLCIRHNVARVLVMEILQKAGYTLASSRVMASRMEMVKKNPKAKVDVKAGRKTTRQAYPEAKTTRGPQDGTEYKGYRLAVKDAAQKAVGLGIVLEKHLENSREEYAKASGQS